ncbi:MAG: enoyl-CoA hydratase/isomerase family protein [Chloroflexota bacterium]
MEYKGIKLENLLFQQEGEVAIVTLNRPQRLNALSQGLQDELVAVLDEMEKDDAIGAAIITGAARPDGRPCFSAGADIKEMAEKGGSLSERLLGTKEEGMIKALWAVGENRDKWQFTWNRVQQFSKPTIAAIDGVCTAGGLELALVCDIRVVAETAEIRDLHMKNLGILGGGGLQTWLPRVINVGKAKEMMWTGDPIDGKEAYRLEFAQRVFPREKLMEGATELAKRIAANPRVPMKISKMVINANLAQTPYESLRFSAAAEALLRMFRAGDEQKSREAFTQKK